MSAVWFVVRKHYMKYTGMGFLCCQLKCEWRIETSVVKGVLSVNTVKPQFINFCLRKWRAKGFSLLADETMAHPTPRMRFLGLVLDESPCFMDTYKKP